MGRRSRRYALPGGVPTIPNAQRAGLRKPPTIPAGLLSVPALEQMWTESAVAIFGRMERPHGSAVIHRGPASIAAKRNLAVEELLRMKEFEWLLFIDSDMTPAPDTLVRLWESGKDIVSGLCFMRQPPFPPAAGYHWTRAAEIVADVRNMYLPLEQATGGLVEVEWCGAACLLIRRHVLEAIPHPWFDHPDKSHARGVASAEDSYFCDKALDHGFSIWVHTGVTPGHVGTTEIDLAFARQLEGTEEMAKWWQLHHEEHSRRIIHMKW